MESPISIHFWIPLFILAIYFLFKLYITLVVFKVVFKYLICKYCKKERDLRKCYGEWAVVTGGSYGIGKYYAIELAKRKMNILLICRNEEKLKIVSQEIGEAHGVETRYFAVDLTQGHAAIDRVETEVQCLDVGILVNNSGSLCGVPGSFYKLTRENIWNSLSLNICALTDLVHVILPGMRQRGRGLIVNVSSVAALSPNPHSPIYAASKAFVQSFSEAIRTECEEVGVEVQTLSPGFMRNSFGKGKSYRLPACLNPTPQAYAASAVATIGHMKCTSGNVAHEVQSAIFQFMPMNMRQKIMAYFLENLQDKCGIEV
ncbi:inactive hydroxysteroid dehydrogenase-like protein 1 isoform X2 [Neocloeon triangulifer]|uniref:inactive hydroxysteroid dehydrogenase-like protein 1 isoform X2 n=1 Tax=Neocloeon triangulifer TaxID=2078957 RepID=UPI00286EEB65|nr:inactive hydroxysteroid dehydrogenase-like protein 1 isoform X2 [Neocloeon triangulifer]XP_059482172.1 inactive hydroxysteroid dehydrogenase-like protein 1 isoform X2 [Neocloeon triangulifer]